MKLKSPSQAAPRTRTDWAKHVSKGVLEPVARWLLKAGVWPNFLSLLGLLFAVSAGILAALGGFFKGGFVFLLAGLFDAMDGTLARVGGLESRFGAFFDSFMDRYAEAALFLGIVYWSVSKGRLDLVLLTFFALIGSFMVSYARARAEGLGISCKIGLFSRMERFIVLILTLFTGQLFLGLAFLAVMANVTALQRLFYVGKRLQKQ